MTKNSGNNNSLTPLIKKVKYHYPYEIAEITWQFPYISVGTRDGGKFCIIWDCGEVHQEGSHKAYIHIYKSYILTKYSVRESFMTGSFIFNIINKIFYERVVSLVQ